MWFYVRFYVRFLLYILGVSSPIFHPVSSRAHSDPSNQRSKIQLDQHHRGRLCVARLPDVQYGSEDEYSYDTARVKNAAAVLLWLKTHQTPIHICAKFT